MKPAEKEKLRDRYNTTGVEIPVARDGLSIYLHATNPLNELTMDQLKQIFTGKITNWKDVGGPDARIIVYSRENSSGTYVFFKEHVLGGMDFTARAQTMPGTGVVVNAVSKEKNGIGYGGAACQGDQDPQGQEGRRSPGVAPTQETVKAGPTPWPGRCSSTCATRPAAPSRPSRTGCSRPTARPSRRRSAITPSTEAPAARTQVVTELSPSGHKRTG